MMNKKRLLAYFLKRDCVIIILLTSIFGVLGAILLLQLSWFGAWIGAAIVCISTLFMNRRISKKYEQSVKKLEVDKENAF